MRVVATGGTETVVGRYKIHTFSADGNFVVSVAEDALIDILLVGGGGGGGNGQWVTYEGAGGGAGGLIYQADRALVAGTYPIVVGLGGVSNTNGGDTIFDDLIALGGGHGQGSIPASSGGSGGGTWSGPGATGTPGQGNDGGNGGYVQGSGGGGAGEVGGDSSPSIGGNGGDGLAYDISGTLTYYAGGGAGSPSATGGLGGGGNSSSDGAPNTGGGGGGGISNTSEAGHIGGSGIVIIRYLNLTESRFQIQPEDFNISADLDFHGFKSIAMACDNGAALPSAPTEGQWFLHTPTGRSVLMQYVNGGWSYLFNLGATTLYVDPLGTDSPDKGFGTGVDAFLTMQYAFDTVGALFEDNVSIYCGAGTYLERLDLSIKTPLNPNTTLTFYGTTSEISGGTPTSYTLGDTSSAGTRATLTDTTKSWTVDEHVGKVCYVDAQVMVVYSNTSDTLTFLGTMTAPTTYSIKNWDTVLTNTGGLLQLYPGCKFFQFVDMKLEKTSTGLAFNGADSTFSFNRCWLQLNNTVSNGFATTQVRVTYTFSNCYVTQGTTTRNPLFSAAIGCEYNLNRSLFVGAGTGVTSSAFSINNSILIISQGTTLKAYSTAVTLSSLSAFSAGTVINGRPHIEDCTKGISLDRTSMIPIDVTVYSGNTSNYYYENWSIDGVSYTNNGFWNYAETVFAKRKIGGPAITVLQGSVFQNLSAQTASIGDTKTDVQGDGGRIYGVAHVTEGIESPINPMLGDIWIDTN